MNGGTVDIKTLSWSYEDIMSISPRVILPSYSFSYDEESKTYTDLRESEQGLEYLYSSKSTALKM